MNRLSSACSSPAVSLWRHRGFPACRAFAVCTIGLLLCLCVVGLSSADGRKGGGQNLRIVIFKGDQLLALYQNRERLKSYRVCLGLEPVGPKKIVGDKRTPEGDYFICLKSTESKFHRFLGISYPGERDAQIAFEQGLISLDTRDSIIARVRLGEAPPWDTKLGGWVGIHGYPTDEYQRKWASLFFPKPHNWTDGCIALWNFEIEELFYTVPLGTRITILP